MILQLINKYVEYWAAGEPEPTAEDYAMIALATIGYVIVGCLVIFLVGALIFYAWPYSLYVMIGIATLLLLFWRAYSVRE